MQNSAKGSYGTGQGSHLKDGGSMVRINPQQNEFVFKDLKISSKFDSGNLANAKEINSR